MAISILRLVAAAALACGTGGCGTPLGNYQVTDVEYVNQSPPPDYIENGFDWSIEMIRVDLSSSTDIVATASGNLHVEAGFCPLKDARGIDVRGPYADNLSFITGIGNKAHLRRPIRDPKTGLYAYTIYIMPQLVADPYNKDRRPYDLTTDHRDICLRFDNTNYTLTRSVSDVFTVPGSVLRDALSKPPTIGPTH